MNKIDAAQYGDITPVSGTARVVDVLLVTTVRMLFLVLLVGTGFVTIQAT